MTLTLQEKVHLPPRILIYAVHGIGKSTFGSKAPNPIFLQTEDGLDSIDCPAFPLAKSFRDVIGYIEELATKDHDRKTLVVDSADWLEPLIWKAVCEEQNVKAIDDIGYGKGYSMAVNFWRQYIDGLNYLRKEKGMMIIQTAHAEIKRFENPETDAYDRYNIKLHKKASDILLEHSDIVLFANYFVGTKTEDAAFKKEGRKRAIGSGERVLYTTERPAATAKNRYDLPLQIPFDKDGKYWGVIASHVPFFNTQNKEDK